MGILERAADLAELGRVGQREAQLFPRNRSFPEALTRIAVLIPCYNEELTIGAVVRDFRAALPGAEIFVYDNNSRDGTSAAARAAGVEPRREPLAGKGNVVRRMFADVEADVYVLVDGDATYHAPSAPEMVRRLSSERLDMVVGRRHQAGAAGAYRAGHEWGNRMLTGVVGWTFGGSFDDMLSGYRALSRRFVKSFPALATGFETETELTVHALSLKLPVAEVDTPYFSRPEGSSSKLQAADLYRRGAHPDHDRQAPEGGTAARLLFDDRRRVDGVRADVGGADLRDLRRDRPGAEVSHRDRRDRRDDPGVPEPRLRLHPRQRPARATGDAATVLSQAASERGRRGSSSGGIGGHYISASSDVQESGAPQNNGVSAAAWRGRRAPGVPISTGAPRHCERSEAIHLSTRCSADEFPKPVV
ncbi:MAG: glycosyltransferase family 2 protein [Roseiarcus sp.]